MAQTSLEKLRATQSRVGSLMSEHDQAATSFRQNAAIGDFIVGIGTQWLREELSVPSTESKKAVAKLRARWRESPQYGNLETQTIHIVKEVKLQLREAFARPPSLREVHAAVMVPTKLKRITAILDRAIERLELPSLPKTRRRRTRKTSPRTTRRLPAHTSESGKPWLQWLAPVAAFATVMGLSYALSVTWMGPTVALLLSFSISVAVMLVIFLLSHWWTQRTGKAVAAKTLPKRKPSSGKASRKRMRAYRELAFGDTTNWMPWEARPRGPSTEHFWTWWNGLHTLVEHLDDEDLSELLWILNRWSNGIRSEDQGEFRRRYNGLRKRAKEEASGSR